MNRTDSELLQLLQQDLEQGFRLLMARYREPIYWHIRRLLVSHDDAEDATQEAFIRIFRSIKSFKGESSLSTWFYKIATNEALRLLEKSNRLQPLGQEELNTQHSLLADSYIDYSDLETIRLQEAILSLPHKQQIAFNLRYYEEMDYQEIAQVLDSSPASAKMNYHLAKEKIIKQLKNKD